jgi:nucleoside-diphosphate-sugar epimerase
MSPPRVLVTGGSGGIGTVVLHELATASTATVLDLRPPRGPAARFVPGDVLDLDGLVEACRGMDALVHLAAIPNPFADPPERIFTVNVTGTFHACEAAARAGVRRVVLAGSDSATGLAIKAAPLAPAYLPVDEAHPRAPSEAYGLSKLCVEEIGRAYARGRGLEVIVLCPVFVVLPGKEGQLRERGAETVSRNLWAYVEPADVAQAFRLALALPLAPGAYETFLIGAADTLSPVPSLELVERAFGTLPEIRKPEWFAGRPHASLYDIGKAMRVLGYRPRSDWRRLAAGPTP